MGKRNTAEQINGAKKKRKLVVNQEIASESEDEHEESGQESEIEETVQEKKIRLAKKYLEEIERQERDRLDDDEDAFDKSAISNRLREEVLEKAGRLIKKVADKFKDADLDNQSLLRNGHKLSVTCIVVSTDSKFVFSGSKDCSIVKWCLQTAKKLKVIYRAKKETEDSQQGHTDHILALAITSDNKFLASGSRDNLLKIWNPETMELLNTLKGHRDAISGLSFRRRSHNLFSCSFDRTVKIWNLDEMGYLETLFGHHDCITSIDSLTRERAITSGGRDSTVRIWKIIEESQLVFQGNYGSIDCVKLVDEQHFVSGSDDG